MDEYICMVPRNLNKPDTIIHSPIKLNWKQIGYLGLGVGGAYWSFQTSLPDIIKLLMISGSLGVGILASSYRYKGSTIDEMLFDSLTYTYRKHYYKKMNERGDLIVTISAKHDETSVETERKSISVSSSKQNNSIKSNINQFQVQIKGRSV